MKTPIDMINEIFLVLNQGTVKEDLLGSIYKLTRPNNIEGEYIVINSLALVGRQLQEGVANVNIYVPNLDLKFNGQRDLSQPDTVRLSSLANAAYNDLNNHWSNNRLVDIRSGDAVSAPELNAHYINIQVNYKFFNL